MLVGVFPRKADLEALSCCMPGALSGPWSLMPETPAHAIPGVCLERDHRTHLSGFFVLHHPLIACRTNAAATVPREMEAAVPVSVVRLTRSRNAAGDLVVRLGVRLLDEYLAFLAGRCRPN